MKTPYFQRNVRIDRVFGDRYSVQRIKERIYRYTKEEKPPVANFKKKYYKKIYTGPKINRYLIKTSSFYRLYVHYLYAFGILPAKVQDKELTPEYYKEKRKNRMIFDELNFLARNSFQSVKEIDDCRIKLELQLHELKGERETLWRKYHKAKDDTDKNSIRVQINKLTEKVDTITVQRNACDRIIDRYYQIEQKYKNEIESQNRASELIKEDKKKKLRNR